MVFNYLSQFLYKDTEQNWRILRCIFLLRTCGGSFLSSSLLIKFHGLHSRKSINNFQLTINFTNNFMLKKCINIFFEFIYCFNNMKLLVAIMWITNLQITNYTKSLQSPGIHIQVLRKLPPGKLPPGWFPPDNSHPENFHQRKSPPG